MRSIIGCSLMLVALMLPESATGIGVSAIPRTAVKGRPARRRVMVHRASAGEPEWLAEINRYRVAAGVPAVRDEPSWDEGIGDHLRYLERTPREYFTGSYASAHSENPASPFYTEGGAAEAAASDLEEGGAGTSGTSAIDGWWTAPFHAIGMLRSQLGSVAFAANYTSGYAGLDVIHGIDASAPKLAPVLFPGPSATTGLTQFGGEYPDPRESCRWTNVGAVGLPLIALLPSAPPPGLTARLEGPAGETSSASGSLCVVDEHTYVSADQVYGPTGLAILEGEDAVLLLPNHPLSNGQYTVHIEEAGADDVNWSFSVDAPEPMAVTRLQRARLPVSMSLARGTALILAPGWMVGEALTLETLRERRVCRRAGRCRWSAYARSKRQLSLKSRRVRARLPVFRGRLVVQLKIPALRHGDVLYPGTTITGVLKMGG